MVCANESTSTPGMRMYTPTRDRTIRPTRTPSLLGKSLEKNSLQLNFSSRDTVAEDCARTELLPLPPLLPPLPLLLLLLPLPLLCAGKVSGTLGFDVVPVGSSVARANVRRRRRQQTAADCCMRVVGAAEADRPCACVGAAALRPAGAATAVQERRIRPETRGTSGARGAAL
eukprot:363670-Chlamydomonas_euryale.AAC.21